jgi:hypothetical protein
MAALFLPTSFFAGPFFETSPDLAGLVSGTDSEILLFAFSASFYSF